MKNKQIMLFFFTLYKIVLDISYIFFVSELFDYAGFPLHFNYFNYILSWILLYFLAFVTPYNIDRASNYFFMSSSLFVLIPLYSLYGLTDWTSEPVVVSTIAISIIYILTNTKINFEIKLPVIKNGREVALLISLFFIALLIFWYFISGAVRYFNLNLAKVYEFRENSAALANVGVMAYLNNWTYKVFLIYALSWMLLKKYYYFAALLILIQIFFFGVSAHKSVLFTPMLIISIWWYFGRFKTLLIMPLGIVTIIILSIMSYFLFDDIFTPSLLIRRVLFIPAKLTYEYFSFFTDNDFIYWGNSILSYFIEYKYHLPVPLLIGEYDGSGASANNGFISSGYSHAGFLGIIFYSIIISVLLRILDFSVKKGVPVWFALSMVIIPLRSTLLSSDLFTTLLTHGLFIAFILLYLSIDRREV